MIEPRMQKFIINKLLLPLVEATLLDSGTISNIISAVERVKAELIPFRASGRNQIRSVAIPNDSPIADAIRVTPSMIQHSRSVFKREATEKLQQMDKLFSDLQKLDRYYPSEDQRKYIVSYLHQSVLILDEAYTHTEAQQISFELPK